MQSGHRNKINFVMEDTRVSTTMSGNEESETHSGEPRHAEFELEHDQERGIAKPALRNEESDTNGDDTDSDEHVKGYSGSTSRNEERYEETKNQVLTAFASKNEESDTDSSSELSSGDIEIEQERKKKIFSRFVCRYP